MKFTRAPVKDKRTVFGLFHQLSVFFMVSNGELPCGVFPSGTDRWEMVEK